FEIRNSYSSGIKIDIWDNQHPFLIQNLICVRRQRTICRLSNNFRLDTACIILMDNTFQCSWNKDITSLLQSFRGIRKIDSSREIKNTACCFTVRLYLIHIYSILIVDRSVEFNKSDQFSTSLLKIFCGVVPHVSESLNNDAFAREPFGETDFLHILANRNRFTNAEKHTHTCR